MSKSKKILMMMSGSIACYKVCSVISKLIQNNYDVKVVLSKSASQFIGASTIEGLTGHPPVFDLFESGRAMEHIHLERWADLILLAPATANTINKIATGQGDDLISTLFLAHDFKKPFLVAPAMNTKMYEHPITQKSIKILKNLNIKILETASGVLACGETGYGKLLDPNLIFSEIEQNLNLPHKNISATNSINPSQTKKVLVVSGGTQEPIDDVRLITNRSTGKTGATLADQFSMAGFNVTYLSALTSHQPSLECTKLSFTTFNDLTEQLHNVLPEQFDLVIFAAAVSDYSVIPNNGKIDSSQDKIYLELIKNPKLINRVKKTSPYSKLVGFKLTSTTDQFLISKKIESIFEQAQADLVVHNDWSTVKLGSPIFNIYSASRQLVKNITLSDLGNYLVSYLMQEGDIL